MENWKQKYITPKNITFSIIAILFIVIIAQISEIAIMFFATFVIACSLEPLVQKLEKKYKRNVACVLVLLGSILIIGAIFVPIFVVGGHEIAQFIDSFPKYVDSIKEYMISSHWITRANLAKIDINGVLTSVSGTTSQVMSDALNAGKNIGSAFIYLIVSVLLIYYFMADKEIVKGGMLRLFPVQMRERTGEIFDAIAQRSGGYIIAQIVTIASIGIIVTIGLLLLKNEYALLLGLLSAIFDIIPVVGPAIAFLICMVVVYKSGPLVLALTAVIFVVAQLIENNFVRPYVFSKFLDLHPLIIYLFLLIAAKYMGVVGVIFAPAIAATVVVLIEEVYIKNIEANEQK
jgi:predicted PurR-regulated permease PerM